MISQFLCNAVQSVCPFCTCYLQVGRSAGPVPPPLFTVGDVVKQAAQRTYTPQHLPKTHLRCERGIWGLHGTRYRMDEGIAEIPLVQTTSVEAYCGSETENTNTTVFCRLSLRHKQHSATCPGKLRLLWLKWKRAALLRAHGLELLFPRSV